MTRSEREAVERRAGVLRVRISTWMRAVVLDALDSRRDQVAELGQSASSAPDPGISAAVEQLRRVGINLNQALRRDAAVDNDLVREVSSAVDEVRASLGDRTSA